MVTLLGGGEARASFGAAGTAHGKSSGLAGRALCGGPLCALGGFVLILIAALALREVASLSCPASWASLIAPCLADGRRA